VGHTSGRQYRNPVSAYPLGDGFVIAVLYGTESNWVRNVMAAGGFTLPDQGPRLPAGTARDHHARAGPARLSGPISQEDAVTQHPGLRLGAPGSSALTGGIGQQLLEQAVAAVHDVTAVVRNADKLTRQVRTFTADLAG
jgi:hypothetical protein